MQDFRLARSEHDCCFRTSISSLSWARMQCLHFDDADDLNSIHEAWRKELHKATTFIDTDVYIESQAHHVIRPCHSI